MLNLAALNIIEESSSTIGTCTFTNLNAAPYFMEEDGRVNAGVSFAYEGGKFSCPIDPVAAKLLTEAAERHKINFTKVELEVTPAAFGREKKAGIKATKVVGLWCGNNKVYPSEAAKK